MTIFFSSFLSYPTLNSFVSIRHKHFYDCICIQQQQQKSTQFATISTIFIRLMVHVRDFCHQKSLPLNSQAILVTRKNHSEEFNLKFMDEVKLFMSNAFCLLMTTISHFFHFCLVFLCHFYKCFVTLYECHGVRGEKKNDVPFCQIRRFLSSFLVVQLLLI